MSWNNVHSGIVANNTSGVGCFNATRRTVTGNVGGKEGSSATVTRGVAFSAASSNSIYGSSTTVQPKSRKCNFIIKAY